MSLLSNLLIILTISIQSLGLTTAETPLFSPALSAREIGLSKASAGDKYFNNMLRNPASISGTKGLSIHTNEFLEINYSSLSIVNEYNEINFGIHYIGSSVNNIERSIVSGTTIEELGSYVPYEYHALSGAIAKEIDFLSVGVGFRYKTTVLDNIVITSMEGSAGFGIDFLEQFRFSSSIQNFTISNSSPNALQYVQPIYTTSINYYVTNGTSFFLSFIHNDNEVNTHLTVHYSVEHYVNDFLSLRAGIDHNRYTFGSGIILDPFEIDIGWAQSRSPEINDQITIGFSYLFEQSLRLYK